MRLKATILTIAFLFFASTGLVMAKRQDFPGAVYTATNSVPDNKVLVFNRSSDGLLSYAGEFDTTGSGTGDGLGNQTGVLLTTDHQWLYVVNAGSDTISVFKVKPNTLEYVGSFYSEGTRPVSLTIDGDLLYVLNAGGAVGAEDNITGFMIEPDGMLLHLEGSTQPLSGANTSPAQIEFSTDGNVLVVTEKGTSIIDTYVLDDDGLAGPPNSFLLSAGTTPFGFSFSKRNRLYVSEAGTSSASSYQVYPDGDLEVISATVPINQAGVCWLVATNNGRYAYTTNAGSGTIAVLNIYRDGSLSLLDIAEAVGGVLDLAFSNNSHFLYALGSDAGKIISFQVSSGGGLTQVEAIDIPPGANGLAAY
jgi:6-phosphogluconolactonase